jgi:predicted RNA-binding Zn-ribbon protein involved in translation (DUF1610 family)
MIKPFSPPQNFEQVDSLVEGITVFAPQKEAEKIAAPVTFQCPNCGASTRFDVSAGGVACEHCGFTAKPKTEAVGVQAKTNEFTLEALSRLEKGLGVERKVLHCDSCGAELLVNEGSLSVTCPFCASNAVNIRSSDKEFIRPSVIIPFKIKPDENLARARQWLSRGWYHPDNLTGLAAIDHFIGAYFPFWTFDASINSVWEAEVGYEREERYYDQGSKEWRSRTVIDWVWRKGNTSIQVADLLVPGTSHISRVILGKIYPFQLSDLTTYTPEFLAGWQAQSYDIDLPTCWEEGKNTMREKSKQACYDDTGSSHVRNFSMSADFDDESWRYILLPIYLTSYKFEDKTFQVLVNGQTGTIAGQKPVAWWKIWLAVAALLLPGVLFCLVGLPLLLAGGIGAVPLIIGFILFVIGVILSIILYRKALDSEAA